MFSVSSSNKLKPGHKLKTNCPTKFKEHFLNYPLGLAFTETLTFSSLLWPMYTSAVLLEKQGINLCYLRPSQMFGSGLHSVTASQNEKCKPDDNRPTWIRIDARTERSAHWQLDATQDRALWLGTWRIPMTVWDREAPLCFCSRREEAGRWWNQSAGCVWLTRTVSSERGLMLIAFLSHHYDQTLDRRQFKGERAYFGSQCETIVMRKAQSQATAGHAAGLSHHLQTLQNTDE